MKRFIMYSELKPDKVRDYEELHADPWPELLKLLDRCNIHHYSISLRGNQVFTYYEYTGTDYEKDMEIMDHSPVMQKWWTYSKPCFTGHETEQYYEELREVFWSE